MSAERIAPKTLPVKAVLPWSGVALVSLMNSPSLLLYSQEQRKVAVQEGATFWTFYAGYLRNDMNMNLVECLGFTDRADDVLQFFALEKASLGEAH